MSGERTDGRKRNPILTAIPIALAAGGLFTSVAYYFGWVYLLEQYAEYGTRVEVIGYSRSEIVFRSFEVFVGIAVWWLVAAVILWGLLHMFSGLRDRQFSSLSPRRRLVFFVVYCAASAATLYALRPDWYGLGQSRNAEYWLFGVGLSLTVAWVLISDPSPLWEPLRDTEQRVALRRVANSAVVLVLVASTFVTLQSVARDAGVRAACQWERDKELLGRVLLVAGEPVAIGASTLGLPSEYFLSIDAGNEPPTAPEVSYVRELSPDGPWEYGGLRILTAAAGRYWVFAASASPRNGIVGVEADRFEIVRVEVDLAEDADIGQVTSPLCQRLL